jgi:hypothetical protein
MNDLIAEFPARVAPMLLRNALAKAELAQSQLWDAGAPPSSLGLRQVESMCSVLMAWVAIESAVNEAAFAIFKGKSFKLPKGIHRTQENRLRECIRMKLGDAHVADHEPLLTRLAAVRDIRNRLAHHSAHEQPTIHRWEGMPLPGGMGVGWMLAAPPTAYTESVLERIDPERAWQFCAAGIEVMTLVYGALKLDPALGDVIGRSSLRPDLLPSEPTIDDLMKGIPIWQLERYWRALRAAQQYTDQWWVLQPDGKRRPYHLSDDLRQETILTAFEGHPTPESLGESWQNYEDSLPPLAMKTKRIVRGENRTWVLIDPVYREWPIRQPGGPNSSDVEEP